MEDQKQLFDLDKVRTKVAWDYQSNFKKENKKEVVKEHLKEVLKGDQPAEKQLD